MSHKAAAFLLAAVLFAAALPCGVCAEEQNRFPEPFVSKEDPYGRNTGIYLPASTTDQELKAALLLRMELGDETWKEDMLLLGTFDALPEGRENRILVASLPDLPEEARQKMPTEFTLLHEQGLCYTYEDEKGTVMVLTADQASSLPLCASSLLEEELLSNTENSYVVIDMNKEQEQEETVSTEAEEYPEAELDLSLWPYPFSRGGKLLPLSIVFPDNISDTELNLLGRVLAMKVGRLSPDTDITVIRWEDAEKDTGRNQIVIGQGEDNGYLKRLLGSQGDTDIGCIRLMKKEEEDQAVLLLYGKDEETLSHVLRFLREEENTDRLEGNCLMVDDQLQYTAVRLESSNEEAGEGSSASDGRVMLVVIIAAGALTATGLVLLVLFSIRDKKNEKKV